jgi:hypothetical protein
MLTKNQAEQLSESVIGLETSSRAVSLWRRVAEFFNPSNCPEFSQLSLPERLEIKQQARRDVLKTSAGRVARYLPLILVLGYILYQRLFNAQVIPHIFFLLPFMMMSMSWINKQVYLRVQVLAKELVAARRP